MGEPQRLSDNCVTSSIKPSTRTQWPASQSAQRNYPTVTSLPPERITAELLHQGFHLYVLLLWRKLALPTVLRYSPASL